jgi:hypothetical protein
MIDFLNNPNNSMSSLYYSNDFANDFASDSNHSLIFPMMLALIPIIH